jgi:hypothetical protein
LYFKSTSSPLRFHHPINIEILLEELYLEFCPLGSTTFKNPEMMQGIEPDNCFDIEHEASVRVKMPVNVPSLNS